MFTKFRFSKAVSFFTTLVMLVGIGFPATTHAQVAGATLSGTVTDQSGGFVPQAAISVRNVATDITRTTTTSSAGFYSVPNLLPGTYDVKTTAQGFSTHVSKGVVLTVGEQQVLDCTLQVGQTTQTIEVSTEAPNVELASSSISATVNSTTVRELPLNGRSWTDLAALQPGVSAVSQIQTDFAVGGDRGNRGFGNQITVAGDRPEQNNYRLDGISINDFNNSAPGSVLGGDLGVDAVQEFSVITSNVSAEYGRTSGGVINAVTKSGTNQFHGSAYEFLRNDALDAANFFENAGGLKKGSFRQNQFGVSGGAPILKDKFFVFGDYEGIRYSKGIPVPITVPSNDARLGIIHDNCGNAPGAFYTNQSAYGSCSAPVTSGYQPDPVLSPSATCPANSTNRAPGSSSVCVDNNSLKYLGFWPVSANTNSDGNTAASSFTGQRLVTEDFFTIRSDYKISGKDNLAGTYLRDVTPYTSPDGLDAVQVSSSTRRQILSLEETHTFGATLVNTVRAGYSRLSEVNDFGSTAINPLAKDPTLAAFPGQYAAHIVISAIDQFTGGVNGNTTALYAWNSFQGYDDAFWTHGTHSFKFGGGVERQQLNRLTHTDPSGVFNFSTLSDLITNNPHRFTGEDFASVGPQGLRQTIFGVYAQDDWRFRPNLTLNLGLRWEMVTAIQDNHGAIVNMFNMTDPLPHCGAVVPGQCAPGGPLFGNNTLHNFEPRVGFAWDPFHNGKTAVRGSFGMFDILPLAYQYIAAASKQFPFVSSGVINSPGQGTLGTIITLPPPANDGGTKKGGSYTEQFPKRSYVMQWNLNVQRELFSHVTLMVGYVGSRGVHEPFRSDDADITQATLTPYGYLYPQVFADGSLCIPPNCASNTGNNPARVNDNYGQIHYLAFEGNSYYHALEVAVQKEMSHGVQFQTSYTWGKSLDTGSAAGHGDQFANSISSLPVYDLRSLRARSDFDIKRTFVVSLEWQVPSGKSLTGPAAWIANGWELGTIFKVNDGVPFTATWGTGGDPQGLLNSDDWAFPNRVNTPACQTLTNPGNPNHFVKTECFTVPSWPDQTTWANNCDPAPPSAQPSDPTAPQVNAVFPQCFNLRGNAGRNLLTGPGMTNMDFSVFKNQSIKKISETFNVQFRAEFFNILNHPNFDVPSLALGHTDIFDATGSPNPTAGVLNATSNPGREIQFALKVGW
jgi:Carboxypeptidase regulatory-like domain/TonB-dependent Receptor Plug Domain